MNKNFENAYQAEVQQNIPDLWNRIESSLPEKTPITNLKADSNETVAVAAENMDIYKQPNPQTLKKKNKYAWIKWASLAAACLLVVLILPTVVGIGALGIFMIGSKSSADMAATESENMTMDSGEYDGAPMEEGYYEYEAGVNEALEDSTSGAETEDNVIVQDETAMEEGAEEEIASSAQQSEPYRELIIEEMYAEVTEVTVTAEGYVVTLNISDASREEADECLEHDPFYEDGVLKVKVYEDAGEIPVVGEMYSVAVYDCTPPWQSMIEPCEAVLEPYE